MDHSSAIDSVEFNKAFIINHFEEFVNKKNAAIALVNFSDDFLDHDEAGGIAVGPIKAKEMMERMYTIFDGLMVHIDDIIAEGDKVMVRNIWSGTYRGERVQFKGFVLWRLKGGKIVERWATVTAPYPVQQEKPSW